MTDSLDLQCSDDLFQSLVEAAYCSFILLVLRRNDQPIKAADIACLLSLNAGLTGRLLDMLIRFGFVLPVENGFNFPITASGIDLLSPQPVRQPWDYDPNLTVNGARLPSNIAFDLLPLRIYSYRRSEMSLGNDQVQD